MLKSNFNVYLNCMCIHLNMRRWTLSGVFVAKQTIATLLLLFTFTSTASAVDYSPENLKWTNLKYTGSKLFVSLKTSISIDTVSKSEAEAAFIIPPEGKGKAAVSNEIVKINVNNAISSVLGGSNSDFTTWLEPNTEVLQRTSVYGGIKEWYRTYRFMDGKVYSDKRKPAKKSEKGKTWDHWTKISPGYSVLDEDEKKIIISEPEVLAYLVGVADLEKKGDAVTFNTFDKKGVVALTASVIDEKMVSVDYQLQQGDKASRVNKKVQALEVQLTFNPIRAGVKLRERYKTDIRMLVDPELKVILKISGDMDYAGHVTFRLESLVLKP